MLDQQVKQMILDDGKDRVSNIKINEKGLHNF